MPARVTARGQRVVNVDALTYAACLENVASVADNPLYHFEQADIRDAEAMRRAVALHLSPDPDRAVQEVDRLLAIRPDDPYYEELKGQILLESGRGAQAVAPYRRAVALAPDEPLILGDGC